MDAPRYNLFMVSGDTGIARGVENVFRHTLREFSRYWAHVDVCVPHSAGAEQCTLFGNVHVHPCDRTKLLLPSFVEGVGRRILLERPIDVVAAHSYPFFRNEAGALRVARAAGALYVVEVMHVVGHPRATDLDEKVRRWAARVGYARVCSHADVVRVINSIEVPEFLCEQAGVPREKILVRPCFYLDFQAFHPPARREFAGRTILYSGRLAKNKGLRELCEAVAIARQCREVRFQVLGDGEMRPQLERWIRELGIADVSTLLGHQPHTAIGDIYRGADVLVMNSNNEGGPRVTLEAMACGTPVISTRIGIMREVVVDRESGVFCTWDPPEIADRILEVLGDPAFAARLSAASPPAVAHFEYSRVIRDYAEGYIQALERRRGTATV